MHGRAQITPGRSHWPHRLLLPLALALSGCAGGNGYDVLSVHACRGDVVVDADFRNLASCVETAAARQRIDAGLATR